MGWFVPVGDHQVGPCRRWVAGRLRWPVRDGAMLVRRPESAADALAGSVPDVYGDVREYVDAERASWT